MLAFLMDMLSSIPGLKPPIRQHWAWWLLWVPWATFWLAILAFGVWAIAYRLVGLF